MPVAISGLPAAADVDSDDLIPVVRDGTTSKATAAQVLAGASGVTTARTISTTAPLTGGGDLSANRTLAISPADATDPGSMSAAHYTKLEGIEALADVTDAANVAAAGAVMTTRSIATTAPLTGGGDLSSDRTLAISPASQSAAGSMSAREFDMALRQQQGYRYSMDFENSVTGTPWTSSVGGSGTANSVDTTDYASHVGVISSETGTTSSGRAAIALRLGSLVTLGSGEVQATWVVSVPALSTLAEEFIVIAGLGNLVTGEPSDGVYFLYDRLNRGANWQLVTAEDGARTYTDTGIAVAAGSWYRLRGVVNAAGTSVEGFIGANGANPTSVGTDAGANIPITSDPLGPIAAIVKSAGGTTRQLLSDLFVLDITFTVGR
jgi:hypothetical protein